MGRLPKNRIAPAKAGLRASRLPPGTTAAWTGRSAPAAFTGIFI